MPRSFFPNSVPARRLALYGLMILLGAASVAPAHGAGYAGRPQVVGGSPVSEGQFPFLVRITSVGGGFCTGSLISERWVLSAVHCGAPDRVYITDAVPGSAGPDHLVFFMEPERWIPHPDYNPVDFSNDIALIELPLDASDFPPSVDDVPLYTPEPLSLASGPATTAASIGNVIIAGFGATTTDSAPDVAEWAGGIPTVGANSCFWDITASKQLCYGSFPNTCFGDSGGAVFKSSGGSFIQYGIVSFGTAGVCGEENSVATYVPGYLGWISDQIDPPAADPITLGWELPQPSSNGAASGISNIQGFGFSSEGTITSVELFVDGVKAATVPCCSERGDVKDAFPSAPLRSGFSAAFNWGLFSAGNHQMRLLVKDSAGNQKEETRTVRTVRILPGVTFAQNMSTAQATCVLSGTNGFECTGLTFTNGTCGGEITFRWNNGKQALEVIEGCH